MQAPITLLLMRSIYNDILKHLFPSRNHPEEVAFIFANVLENKDGTTFKYDSWYPVHPDEYESQSRFYVELKDEMRPKIIKMASDINASIIEVHSHVLNKPAFFSYTDMEGFDEFVPHILWRLRGKPYAALVFSRKGFDGLVWNNTSKNPVQFDGLIIDDIHQASNGLTLSEKGISDDL